MTNPTDDVTRPGPDEVEPIEPVDTDDLAVDLVEEISIDGMCGVY